MEVNSAVQSQHCRLGAILPGHQLENLCGEKIFFSTEWCSGNLPPRIGGVGKYNAMHMESSTNSQFSSRSL